MIYYAISQIHTHNSATGKNFEWRAFFPNCGFNAKVSGTSDTKILPKGCQLRRGECVPYFVNHRRFHKWLMSLFNHFYKQMSRV